MCQKRSTTVCSLSGGLIVSCQPVVGSVFDTVEGVVGFAQAAIAGGCQGLRIEGADRVAAVAQVTTLPIVGIVKRELADTAVRITPWVEDVERLAEAGATIIAFDATDRVRPVAASALLNRIHDLGCVAMADCSSYDEGMVMAELGCDLIASTLSGYTGGVEPSEPDFELVRRWADAGLSVIAEGRYRTAEQACEALKQGALGVTVGSAITRPEVITRWFLNEMTQSQTMANRSARY